MPQLDSDSFTYSNGLLATVSGGKWTKLSGFIDLSVSSNQLKGGTNNQDHAAVITSWSGSTTNHYSQAVIATMNNDGGPTIRANAASTFYLCDTATSGFTIYKCVTGTFTSLTANSPTISAGDTIYFEAQGNTLTVKQNGTTRITFGDSSIASGKPGMHTFDNLLVWDNWAAGDFSAGAAFIPRANSVIGQAAKRASYF
jgi:hypothetical protein